MFSIPLLVVQTSFLLIAFLIQYQLVFPIESLIIDPSNSAIVSLLFIPHGVKSILIALTGPAAIIPVFISQFISDVFLGQTFKYGLISSFESVTAVVIPLMLLNFMTNRNSLSLLRLDQDYNFSLIRVVMAIAIIQGLTNSIIRSAIHEDLQLNLLTFRYLIGDVLGTLKVLALTILLRCQIIKVLSKLI